MQFIDCVNRILRTDGYIRGDTDALANFSNLQHGSTMNLSIVAIQDALSDISGDLSIPMERKTATLTMLTNVRTYALATDFAKFYDENAFFYDEVQNNEIYEYPGGESQLRIDVQDYAVSGRQLGDPTWWYWVDSTLKTVGFFQTPDSGANGRLLTYDYQKTIMPTLYNDVLPFQQDAEAFAFTEMALIRFKAYINGQAGLLDFKRLPAYISAMAKTTRLINPKVASSRYGHVYR